jgi:hypothetical protein
MSINTREDANKYYNQINGLIDDYIDKWKIKPSNLKSYLKPGTDRYKKFLIKNNLSDVVGANVILNDVIDDRVSIEKDGIQTFENFKYFESQEFKIDSLKQCIYKGIERSDINYEKAIADYFDCNLGSIDIIDSDKHKFKLEDWNNDDWNVVIYSEEEIDIILHNIVDYLYEELVKKDIELIRGISISLPDLIVKENFEKKILEKISDNKLNQLISDCIGSEWSYKGKIRNFHIWIS